MKAVRDTRPMGGGGHRRDGKGGVLPLECEYLYGVHLTQDYVDGDLPNN